MPPTSPTWAATRFFCIFVCKRVRADAYASTQVRARHTLSCHTRLTPSAPETGWGGGTGDAENERGRVKGAGWWGGKEGAGGRWMWKGKRERQTHRGGRRDGVGTWGEEAEMKGRGRGAKRGGRAKERGRAGETESERAGEGERDGESEFMRNELHSVAGGCSANSAAPWPRQDQPSTTRYPRRHRAASRPPPRPRGRGLCP